MKKNFLYSVNVIIFNLVVFFAILQLYFLYSSKISGNTYFNFQ